MPLVLRIDRYCVFFWANEGAPLEPVHHATKIWLLASGHCRLCSNGSRIPKPALRNIMRVLEAYHEEIAEKWVHGKRAGKVPLLPTNTRQARTVCPVMI